MLEEDFGTAYDVLDIEVWNEGDEELIEMQRQYENKALKRTQLVALQLRYSALSRKSTGSDREKYKAFLDIIQEELDELETGADS